MKLAFYKGKGDLFDRIVRFWTGSVYSHVEYITPDGRGFSSSLRDGGVRVKDIDFSDTSTWEIVEVDYPDWRMMAWYSSHEGLEYDVWGLLGFLFRPGRGDPTAYFCSEAVASALEYEEAFRFDVATLYQVVKRDSVKYKL